MNRSLLFVVNVDWFFLSHRLPIALEAIQQGYEVHIATGITSHRATLEAHGLVVHSLTLDRSSTGLLSIVQLVVQLWNVFRSVQPDVVHLVTIKPVLLGGLVARVTGVPGVVAAVSGLGFVFVARGVTAAVRRAFVALLYRLALGHHNLKAIFQNPDDCATLSRVAHLPPRKVALIRGSGVDLALYRPAPMPEGAPVVMLAARLLVDKGVREFVAAAYKLKGQFAEKLSARFVLVGEIDPGNPTSLDAEEVELWRDEGVIEVWGHCTDMPRVLATAHIVVLPSYREGLPKVLIEAAAVGRAVITTDVAGCRDAIDPDVTGVLVPPRNVDALTTAIGNLLRDAPRCMAMGQAGRCLAESAFDQRHVIAKHMDIYGQLVERA